MASSSSSSSLVSKMIAGDKSTLRIVDQDLSLQCDHAGRVYFYCICCDCEYYRCSIS